MSYTSETLSDARDAVRELVLRPIYAGHGIRLDHAMFTRRIATAAVLLVLCGAGCASHGGTNLAVGPEPAIVLPAAPVAESTTTTSTTMAVAAGTTSDTGPVVNATPAPATIEVDYQPLDGSSAKATIEGPNGSHSKSLDSGAALFGGLPAGTYAVTITIDSPSGDPSIGDARVYLNGGNVHVEPGDHGVIVCDDNGCSGAL